MKFQLLLISMVATADAADVSSTTNTVERWGKCTTNSDCIQSTDACCLARYYDTVGTVSICGPYQTGTMILNADVPKYAHYEFDCGIVAGATKIYATSFFSALLGFYFYQ